MAKTFILLVLCISNAMAAPAPFASSRNPPSFTDEKVVRKNFDFLVGLIRKNPKWVTQILVQIKKEMQLRGKLSAKNGLKCTSCIFQFHYNYSDAPYADSFNPEDPHLWDEVLADSAGGTISQSSRFTLYKQIFQRPRRSLASKLRKSNDSQGSNTTTTTAMPSALPDTQVHNRPSNLTTPRPTAPKSTTAATRTMVPTLATATTRPAGGRFGKMAEKDSLGRAILPCDEKSERTYCQHNGRCVIVKILELKSCSCATGFVGLRCQIFDVVQTIETIDRHVDIRSFDDISDEEERAKMVSSIAATAIFITGSLEDKKDTTL